jgi:hypothetical protein
VAFVPISIPSNIANCASLPSHANPSITMNQEAYKSADRAINGREEIEISQHASGSDRIRQLWQKWTIFDWCPINYHLAARIALGMLWRWSSFFLSLFRFPIDIAASQRQHSPFDMTQVATKPQRTRRAGPLNWASRPVSFRLFYGPATQTVHSA